MSRGLTLEQMQFLVSKGVTGEEMLAFAEMGHAKSKAAERTARWRARKAGNVTERVTCDVTGDASQPPIEELHTPCSPSLDKSSDAPQSVEKVFTAWNETAKRGGLKPSRALNPDRKAKAKRRLAEFGEEAMLEGIRKLAASPFHCGDGSRGWKADFGWYVKSAENVTKALELDDPRPAMNGNHPASNPLLKSLMAKQPQPEGLTQSYPISEAAE